MVFKFGHTIEALEDPGKILLAESDPTGRIGRRKLAQSIPPFRRRAGRLATAPEEGRGLPVAPLEADPAWQRDLGKREDPPSSDPLFVSSGPEAAPIRYTGRGAPERGPL